MPRFARNLPRLVAVVAVAVGIFGAANLALGVDPRLKTCTDGVKGSVQASFAMAEARDYKGRVPRMKLSPELETNEPAFVVVFAGAVSLGVAGAPGPQTDESAGAAALEPAIRQAEFTGVVCVVMDGFPTYYSNVDVSGLTP